MEIPSTDTGKAKGGLEDQSAILAKLSVRCFATQVEMSCSWISELQALERVLHQRHKFYSHPGEGL